MNYANAFTLPSRSYYSWGLTEKVMRSVYAGPGSVSLWWLSWFYLTEIQRLPKVLVTLPCLSFVSFSLLHYYFMFRNEGSLSSDICSSLRTRRHIYKAVYHFHNMLYTYAMICSVFLSMYILCLECWLTANMHCKLWIHVFDRISLISVSVFLCTCTFFLHFPVNAYAAIVFIPRCS